MSFIKKLMRSYLLPYLFYFKICFCSITVSAQGTKPVSDIDFIQIKNGNKAEAMFYYENNWKKFRELALEKGYIKSYKLLTANADSIADFHIILITEYKDYIQYHAKEDHFRLIIKELSPDGPKLLNEKKSRDFARVVFSKRTITEFEN
jgi:hypothetical protein